MSQQQAIGSGPDTGAYIALDLLKNIEENTEETNELLAKVIEGLHRVRNTALVIVWVLVGYFVGDLAMQIWSLLDPP